VQNRSMIRSVRKCTHQRVLGLGTAPAASCSDRLGSRGLPFMLRIISTTCRGAWRSRIQFLHTTENATILCRWTSQTRCHSSARVHVGSRTGYMYRMATCRRVGSLLRLDPHSRRLFPQARWQLRGSMARLCPSGDHGVRQ